MCLKGCDCGIDSSFPFVRIQGGIQLSANLVFKIFLISAFYFKIQRRIENKNFCYFYLLDQAVFCVKYPYTYLEGVAVPEARLSVKDSR